MLTWALWVGAWLALWYRGKLMFQRGYWQGRTEELLAQIEGAEGGPMAYLLKVRIQLEEALGPEAAQEYLDNLRFTWEEE